MQRYAIFLRAVNVGGTGRLTMATLRTLCEGVGFSDVRTYIASGNVLISSKENVAEVTRLLESALAEYAGKPVQAVVVAAEELRALAEDNPFPDAPGNKVIVMLYKGAPPSTPLNALVGRKDEHIVATESAIYIYYPSGQSASKLKMPDAARGTGRNINTIAKMVAMLDTPV